MELKNFSYFILSNNAKVKIYLNDVLDDQSKKYEEEIKKLRSKLFNSNNNEHKKIISKINNLTDKINNVLLFEGMNKDIPNEVLNRSWIPEQSIYAENDTIIIPIEKYIRIKDIQDSLNDNDFYELDFHGREIIVITKDNIYIKSWEMGNSKYYVNLMLWNAEKYISDNEEFNYNYEKIEDYESELIDLIGEEMLRECKYIKTEVW